MLHTSKVYHGLALWIRQFKLECSSYVERTSYWSSALIAKLTERIPAIAEREKC